MKSEFPLVCNMDVFTPAQREAHIQGTLQLVRALEGVQEVEHGYELRFPNKTETILRIAEFISNERLCCPFLKFTLSIDAGDEPISLKLTGPAGTQEFLKIEFAGAIS